MLILGITNRDLAGACLVRDGEPVAAVSEERFTRVKDHLVWPERSIDFVLKAGGVSLEDVDRIAYGWSAGFDADKHLMLHVDRVIYEAFTRPESVPQLRALLEKELSRDRKWRGEFDEWVDRHGLRSRVVYIDHHESHGLGAFLCSPFDDALVVTCDGRGDYQSLTVTHAHSDGEEVLQRETAVDSLGFFYGRITALLGFTPNRHEGKITGLAAKGDADLLRPLMKKMIDVEDGRIRARFGTYFQPDYRTYSQELTEEIAQHQPADVAAAAQAHVEDILTQVVAHHLKSAPTRNVCLAGGVFANVKLNQRIAETAGVDSLYVLPAMGDGGLPLQAAVIAEYRESGRRSRVPSMALGPDSTVSDAEVGEILRGYPGLDHRRVDDGIQEVLLQALEAKQVIGTYRGRMEFGPRALGRRSVIYSTDDPSMNDWLNTRLKRTEFMPFAPITAEQLAQDCYLGWRPEDASALFMTVTYNCTEAFAKVCPAVVHVDGTARPQIVRQQDDPFLHSLLTAWHARSGQAALVNTSFNKHEEPIVCSLQDALDPLQDEVVDLVLVDDVYLVWKTRDASFMDSRTA